ncbi:hypothetical protein [Bradyrhizobium sp. SZCCHNRI1073]|uniref:hypothetical protein n=1 Tax=Bradyrhizobium sp. SZCCHNRI1073 TaxID=3057280 RepID=UPI002916F548|nr:hypothetical protein [Bradyrhizobium sp. SZCCHNRI1073]
MQKNDTKFLPRLHVDEDLSASLLQIDRTWWRRLVQIIAKPTALSEGNETLKRLRFKAICSVLTVALRLALYAPAVAEVSIICSKSASAASLQLDVVDHLLAS